MLYEALKLWSLSVSNNLFEILVLLLYASIYLLLYASLIYEIEN